MPDHSRHLREGGAGRCQSGGRRESRGSSEASPPAVLAADRGDACDRHDGRPTGVANRILRPPGAGVGSRVADRCRCDFAPGRCNTHTSGREYACSNLTARSGGGTARVPRSNAKRRSRRRRQDLSTRRRRMGRCRLRSARIAARRNHRRTARASGGFRASARFGTLCGARPACHGRSRRRCLSIYALKQSGGSPV